MLDSLNVNHRNVNQNVPASSGSTITGYALALTKAPSCERAFTAAKLVLGYLALSHHALPRPPAWRGCRSPPSTRRS
jgi:hypothetical protein